MDVVNTLYFEDLRDVVLVGWSYGGMIVAGASDRAPERIGHLVYLDSDVPRDGDTSSPPDSHARLRELADVYGDGWRVPPDVTRAPELLLRDLPDQQRAWIAARFVPQPARTWTEPIRLAGRAAKVPTAYIRCTTGYDPADVDTMRQDERIRSEPGWRYVELAETHAAPFSAPLALASLLLELAG
jgi:pimeloyl-ACP methyl ester carboxylesterase